MTNKTKKINTLKKSFEEKCKDIEQTKKRFHQQGFAEGFTKGMHEGYFERSKDLPKSYQKGREDLTKELENYIDTFVSLQETKEGITQEDVLNLQMGIEAFLLSCKLAHSKK